MQADPSYASYVRYCGLVGSPILDYEAWARLRHKLDRGELAALYERDKWIASESDLATKRSQPLQRSTSQRLVPHGSESGAASANLPSSPAPLPK